MGGLDQATVTAQLRDLLTPATAVTPAAQVDLDRWRRCGYPEVVFAPGKTTQAIVDVFRAQLAHGQSCLATRVPAEQAAELLVTFPQARHNATARTLCIPAADGGGNGPQAGFVAVITAGTGDLPVAEEAVETAQWMGCQVDLIVDVGVAGPHRLPAQKHRFERADAIVVVAGMEGALPSVVGGHVACPVIAVPTSIGYGASFGGLAALLGMLNSCAANVTVVNIDAGFKGGFLAGLIAQRTAAATKNSGSLGNSPVP
ncbi:MAG: nickel pincer cofactor biosynthesis protein LarB [Planctomycetes bacterium]|nr:nickel pincer cofactor biosynthesis protein LarB [Planctomycetota bacterium]